MHKIRRAVALFVLALAALTFYVEKTQENYQPNETQSVAYEIVTAPNNLK